MEKETETETKEQKKPTRAVSIVVAIGLAIWATIKNLWFDPMTDLQYILFTLCVILIALWELWEITAWTSNRDVVINNLSIQVVKDEEEK